MKFLVWILMSIVQAVNSERGGITHCTAGTLIPASLGTGTTAPSAGTGVLHQDGAFMLTCCGVVQKVRYRSGGGDITAQIWRQTGASAYTLISKNDYTLTSGNPGVFEPDDDKRLSFEEGDLIGWYAASGLVIQKGTDANFKLARVSGSVGNLAVGATFDWNSATGEVDTQYSIQYELTASTDPFFRNLPTTLSYADTETLIGGITLMTLSVYDLDPEDISGLSVVMAPAWIDYFILDNSTLVLTTARKLEPGTYQPVFRVDESHCGRTASSTLTVTVTDSVPSITNLPGSATIHEDSRDQTLLYTVTATDPTSQSVWCKLTTTPAPASGATNTPFIVKMLSTTGGDIRAGIYLIEEPNLDYDVKGFYSLSVICTDTAGNTDTEDFYVSIVKNQPPIFSNLGNMVEIDATAVKIGSHIFTVSTTDAENDQITYASTSCLPADCPFALYDNGFVIVTSNLLLWDTFLYTMTITASDLRDTTTARTLLIYIINRNTAPVFSNLPGNVEISENSNLSLSLFQVSATDVDSDTLTYYMTMNTEEGWKLFDMSSTGEVTTHSVNNIDFDTLTNTVHDMIVYVHDGKEILSATLTLTVLDVNETLEFSQNIYALSHDEGTSGTVLNTANIASTDLDPTDSKTYSMNCGTYDSYFTINSATAAVSYAQNYDLDSGTLPTEVTCNLTVIDPDGFNDTAELYITITYTNDHDPVFSPNSYAATIDSTAPIGFSVLQVTATDADQSSDGTFTYSLSATSEFAITETGIVYVKASLAAASSQSLTATATDGGNPVRTGTAPVVITINTVTNTATTTTDRNRKFKEDSRNIYWLTIAVITAVICLCVIAWIIVRYCMGRKEPLCKDWWTKPKKRKLDKRRRPKPYGRQQQPTYKHLHANEVLRASPPPIMTPDLIEESDNYSNRATSATSLISGRANLSQVDLKDKSKNKVKEDDVNSWLTEQPSYISAVAPEHAVSQPRARDREYLGRGRRKPQVHMPVSPVAPSPSVSIPENIIMDRLQPDPLRVNPSPVGWDNRYGAENESYMPDNDDYQSEVLPIMSPVTVHAEADLGQV